MALAPMVLSDAGRDLRRPATLVLAGDTAPESVEIALGVEEWQLARLLTGTVRASAEQAWELGRIELSGLVASASVRGSPSARRPRRSVRGLSLAMRVLTDEGVFRSWVAYTTDAGAVCVTPDARESFLVREDGSIASHLAWPRPITAELPWGDGAVAWSVGEATANNPEHVVMYRRRRNDEPTIVGLPCRPSRGVWWRGRVYWTCVPLGIASWTPGESPRLSLPDLSVAFVQPDDDGLLIVPRVRDVDGRIRRCLATQAWRWDGATVIVPAKLGGDGVASCRSVAHGWTAVAHPDADLVRLSAGTGESIAVACDHPVRVAWTGRSLLVSTGERELILFEGLVSALEGGR
jgi:hypothetical protein